MQVLFYFYDFVSRVVRRSSLAVDTIRFKILLLNPKIEKGKGIKSIGLPVIRLGKNSKLKIGNNCRMHDGKKGLFVGRDQKCIFKVMDGGELVIGKNVGMSSTTILLKERVILGNNIRVGNNVVIYDSDFHSLWPEERLSIPDPGIKASPVIIEDNVFIGAHSTILKGVTIGANAVIGACSVVSKDIPPDEIWAGNPAKFIRKLGEKKV